MNKAIMRHDMPINTRMRDAVKGQNVPSAGTECYGGLRQSTVSDLRLTHAVPADDSPERDGWGKL